MYEDYWRPNDLTIKYTFSIPLIDNLFSELYGAIIFSKIDLRRVLGGDAHKTTFCTYEGY